VRGASWIVVPAVVALAFALSDRSSAVPVADPLYGITIPAGYRDWTLITVATLGSPLNDLRAKLGNAIVINAFREKKLPYPDGSIIVRLAWKKVVDAENNNAFRQDPGAENFSQATLEKFLSGSFVAGPATNIQIMVKNSKKYASTGGWGFAEFTNGKPASVKVERTCFPCHAPISNRDFVFSRYSP
jgi:hypothetical protein